MRHPQAGTHNALKIALRLAFLAACCACALVQKSPIDSRASLAQPHRNSLAPAARNPGKVIHVVVALCDNEHQGIVPVPARIGNGEDPRNNLYWGAAFGVKTFFARSSEWKLLTQASNITPVVLERCVFKQRSRDIFLVADAYRGAEIKRGISDFLDYAAGRKGDAVEGPAGMPLPAGGNADLIVFVGHNGLMDFSLDAYPTNAGGNPRHAIILCCASKSYFARPLRQTGAQPLLWTNGLMAPEAYVLKAAIDGWVLGEDGEAVRGRAAAAYHQYQRCGLKAARNLFASGW